MAGTFNSKTGYLTVTGINVNGGEIVIDGNVFDSDMIGRMISTSIADMNIDSDTVRAIAENVRLNNLIDSDAIQTISSAVFSATNLDSDVIEAIAVAAQAQILVNINALDSDVAYAIEVNLRQDSDLENVKLKYAAILANDTVQDANIATLNGDVTTLSTRITSNDSDITEIEGDVTALYGRMTSTENTNLTLDSRVDTLDTTVGITGTGGHADRITTLEATVATLQGAIAALTINDLTDVDTTGLAVGDALVWNGTDFVPVAN